MRSDAKPCAAYDRDGQCIAVGDSVHEQARLLGVTVQAVSHGLHRGSRRYAFLEVDDDGADDDF